MSLPSTVKLQPGTKIYSGLDDDKPVGNLKREVELNIIGRLGTRYAILTPTGETRYVDVDQPVVDPVRDDFLAGLAATGREDMAKQMGWSGRKAVDMTDLGPFEREVVQGFVMAGRLEVAAQHADHYRRRAATTPPPERPSSQEGMSKVVTESSRAAIAERKAENPLHGEIDEMLVMSGRSGGPIG